MDMQKCARKYGAGYMDYDLFEMYNLTPAQEKHILLEEETMIQLQNIVIQIIFTFFKIKMKFNTIFNEYLKRVG